MKQKEERSTSINVNGIKFHILLHQAANALVLNSMMKLNYFGSFLGDKNNNCIQSQFDICQQCKHENRIFSFKILYNIVLITIIVYKY